MFLVICMKGVLRMVLLWRVIFYVVGRFCEIKDGVKVDIFSMVYINFRVNFWVLVIFQSKIIVYKGENRYIYKVVKYWLLV